MSEQKAKKATLASGDGILCLAPVRSGSFSLVNALKILGYDDIHHAIFHHSAQPDSMALYRLSWSCLPYMSTLYPNGPPRWITSGGPLPARPFGRSDWDAFFGEHYRGISDLGGPYAESLIKAYPEARVILVQRPFDEWVKSIDSGFITPLSQGYSRFTRVVVGPLIGNLFLQAQWDVLRAWIRGRTADECRRRLKDIYDEHYDMIRSSVPPSQLLILKLDDSWEPLCQFLGEPVPDVPFPHLNDSASLQAIRDRVDSRMTKMLLKKGLWYACFVAVVAILLARGASFMGHFKGERIADRVRRFILAF